MQQSIKPYLLLATWFVAVCSAFWWFEYRHWQAFSPIGVTFNGDDLQPLYRHIVEYPLEHDAVTIAHFADQKCACNRYGKQHRQQLTTTLHEPTQRVISPRDAAQLGVAIPASPAVAVWDKKGKLAYFGPYTSGAICGQGDDFVRKVLSHLSNDHNPQWINMLALGCYCPWQPNSSKENKLHA